MDMIKEKIRVMCDKLALHCTLSSIPVEAEYVECNYKTTNTPPDETAAWKPLEDDTCFEGEDQHYWLHTKFRTPKISADKQLRFYSKTGLHSSKDATNPQFTVYVNGVTTQAMDMNHVWFPLESDKEYDIYLYLYTGMRNRPVVYVPIKFSLGVSIKIIDKRIESLYYDLKVPYDCLAELNDESYDYIIIRNHLDKATMLLDLRHVYSDDFYAGIDKASEYLKTEFYEKECGKNRGTVNCIGHTHIDVAWLWTVAQTREKAQRSFSTVINMMKHYDEYNFMSSQPQLYQYVKEDDPSLYEEIKKRVKEGRWEVEGAMWLEADTNLISGESMVRQLLFGKKFMKDEFGVESEIMWLPDVFGYSGALPQILRKSGVDKFYTSKLNWNEYNIYPTMILSGRGLTARRCMQNSIQAT